MKASGFLLTPLWLLIVLVSGCSGGKDSATPAEPMLIEPNVGVGKIRAGMTVEQVIAAIGEPRTRTANSLVYPQLGLAVMPNQRGEIQVVLCGDVMGPKGPFAKAFKGRTKEGIGMYSSREDLVKAFGEPTTIGNFSFGLPSYKYAELGMDFALENNQVFHIIVRLPGEGSPEPAHPGITIDLAPSTNR